MERNNNRDTGWSQVSYTQVATLPKSEAILEVKQPSPAVIMPTPQPIPTPNAGPMPSPIPNSMPNVIPIPVVNSISHEIPKYSMHSMQEIRLEKGGCDELMLAMAYVKNQKWADVYEPDIALSRGTIFPELDLPFLGEGACPNG